MQKIDQTACLCLAAILMTTMISTLEARSSRHQYQQGIGAYADQRTFSTRGVTPETVVDMQSPVYVSVCNNSDAAIVVHYDSKKESLDGGDCIDVEASKIDIGAEAENASGHGTYRVGNRRDPAVRRSRTGD